MDLFELLGTISIKNSDALKALDKTSQEGEKTAGKMSKAFSAIGKGAVAVGKTVATGLAVAGTAVAGVTAKALSSVGELEQNMGGSEAVFGQHAAKMQETAKAAYSKMGLATSDYLSTANKMGSLFKGAGFEAGEAANMTSEAMQRAADVASIMGISTESAMESIAGAAKGNFTMMDNLGVAMNDTTLQAYALSKGIDKSTQEMTNQEKIGLAMQMFMEKTADYAGNYTKENETLTGSLGTAKAALQNFLDGSGDVDQLVNAFSGAANSIIGSLETLAPRLVSGITDLVNKLTPMLPPLLQKVLPVIVEGAAGLINGLVGVLPQLVSTITSTLLPQLLSAATTIINTLTMALPQLISILASALPTLLPMLIDSIVSTIVTLCSYFGQIIQPIIDNLPGIILSIVSALMENLPTLIDGLITLCLGIVSALPQIIGVLVDILPSVIEMLVTGLLNCLPQLILGFIQLIAGVAQASQQIYASLQEAFIGVFMGIWNGIRNVFSDTGNWFGKTFSAAKTAVTKAWQNVVNWFKGIGSGIKNAFSNISGWFSKTFSSAKNGIQNAWSGVKKFFSNIKDGIVDAFSNVKDKLFEPFANARDKIQEVAEKIKGFFSGELKMPKIKVPKFSIKPKGWEIGDLLDGVIPKLGITWHAKGAIMKEPTLFGYNPATGSLHGGGEAGDEAIAPISTLQQYVKAAVQSENTVMANKLDRIINLLVQFFPEMLEALNIQMYLDGDVLVAETASKYDAELGKIAIKKGRGR